MHSLPSFQFIARPISVVLLVLGMTLGSAVGIAATPSASVVAVQPSRVADIVMLDHGFDGGLREGVVCRVKRGQLEIAEVVVVDLRQNSAAALIVSVVSHRTIRVGDIVGVKILKT